MTEKAQHDGLDRSARLKAALRANLAKRKQRDRGDHDSKSDQQQDQ